MGAGLAGEFMRMFISRKSIKTAFFTAAFLLSLGAADAPPSESEMKDVAKQQANVFAQAIVRSDFDSVIAGTNPKIIDVDGGKDAALKTLQDWALEMKSQNVTIHSVDVGEVSEIKQSDSEQFAIVPESVTTQIPGGWLQSDSYLLGFSQDGGHTWKFVDSIGIEKLGGKLHAILPDLPADLTLPKLNPPIFSVEMPQPPSAPVAIERADFKVTVPPGSTVDPPDADIDKDHYTAVNLPDGATLIFLVIDDKSTADSALGKALGYYRSKLQDPVDGASDMFDGRGGKGTIVQGKLNGLRFVFEAGYFTGKQKAFIASCGYEKSLEADARKVYRQAIDSFAIKE